MPFHPVLEAFGGNLKVEGTGASTANQLAPHFADDVEPQSYGCQRSSLHVQECRYISFLWHLIDSRAAPASLKGTAVATVCMLQGEIISPCGSIEVTLQSDLQ